MAWMCHGLCIYWLTKGHLGCFQVLRVMNKISNKQSHVGAIVEISLQLLWVNIKESDCWILCKSLFSFVRNHQAVSQGSCTSHHQWMRVPAAPYPHQHLVVVVVWILVILKVYSSVWCIIVLICTSLITYYVEHLFLCIFFSEVSVKIFCFC